MPPGNAPYLQLQMVWPTDRLTTPPAPRVPPGYRLRVFQPGDEPRFYQIMALSGWPDWDAARLRPWLARILPGGWFMAIDERGGQDGQDGQIVATCMCLHDHSDLHPFGGEIGWLASDPAHRGKRLGRALCAAAIARLIAGGYRNIHLYTEHWRLAAIRTYLNLGMVPFLYLPEMAERWRAVCEQLNWPFHPASWRAAYRPSW